MSHSVFQIMPIDIRTSSKPFLPLPAVRRAFPLKTKASQLLWRAFPLETKASQHLLPAIGRAFPSKTNVIKASIHSRSSVIMKGENYGALSADTLEISKLDLTQTQTNSSPEQQVSTDGGGGNMGNNVRETQNFFKQMSLTSGTTMSAPTLPIVRAEVECLKQFKPMVSVGLQPLGMQSQFINNGRHLICPVQEKRALIVCAAALNARCAIQGQTQTLTRENSTITVAPGKEKSPDVDDGGAGFTPRNDDGGVGGGGGGGGGGGEGGDGGGGGHHWGGEDHWKGGFFLLIFLVILCFLKDKEEEEGPYGDQRRRKLAN